MSAHDVAASRIAVAGGAIAAMVLAVVATVLLWLDGRDRAPGGARLDGPTVIDREPRGLDSAPQPQLQAARARKMQRLQGLGWVDEAHGIAHIPIDDAMALMVARGAAPPPAAAEGGSASSPEAAR